MRLTWFRGRRPLRTFVPSRVNHRPGCYKCAALLAASALPAAMLALSGRIPARCAQIAHYRPVPNWPATQGPQPPDYGAGQVMSVAIAPNGDVIVVQRTPHPVLVFNRDGRFLRSWGRGMFTAPHGCRVDPRGNLWITDTGDHRVMEFTVDGKPLATWGTRGRAGSDLAHFDQPADAAFGPNGDVYIADGYGNSRVVRKSAAGKTLGAWGRRGTRAAEFHLVHAVAVDATGRVYVADRENARIQVFTAEGRFLKQWRGVGHPFGLFLTPDQRLFVADGVANTIAIYDLQGKRLGVWGHTGSGPGQFRRAHWVCVAEDGAIYVTEVNGRRIQKFVLSPSP